ncbi:type I glyceraldehyde-3-phosphate dehydrogenase [Vulgatibacter incomptus]|uniref:Glyceraldehyde-3-phosphate dehydrogenase n=1 Tax=Vulgatibacter incomptus TaxID=1391653 RepID=A0A0K1PA93_9BACT|nr:type I glyceraldehyde-3-phosphate dehydrogenase [Vulgatibacter incomptus]AKU90458.1 NAD-dependent glyceraldehyde-3-phosphate dehydrogenase [Vulgatibacter incomptus]
MKFAINGFGRIGRCVLRAALARNEKDVEIVGINDLDSPATLAHLFKYDSVHGIFPGEVKATERSIVIDGKEIPISAIREPEKLPWKELGVETVFECTGRFTDREAAAKHQTAGARKVLISAPAKNPDITLCYGINHDQYDPAKHHIFSNASCTTNCLAPVVKVLLETFGVERGLMTTVHSYTNDQSILDLPHKDLRRARAAAVSMIPTSTGAAKAVGEVIPQLKGKLTGMSVRVPTPNVSLVDFTAVLTKKATVDEVNAAMKKAAEGSLKGVLHYSEEPLVSVDYNHSPWSSTVDALSTMVIDDMVKVLAWYDNEWGFSNRMVDVARMIATKG